MVNPGDISGNAEEEEEEEEEEKEEEEDKEEEEEEEKKKKKKKKYMQLSVDLFFSLNCQGVYLSVIARLTRYLLCYRGLLFRLNERNAPI